MNNRPAFSRFRSLSLLLFLIVIAIAACSPAGSPQTPAEQPGNETPGGSEDPAQGETSYEGQVLVVGTFGGVYKENLDATIGELFRQRTGATVEYVEGNPANHRSKIIASRGVNPPMDVFLVDAITQVQLSGPGLIQPLDFSRIANADDVLEDFKGEHFISFGMFDYGIAYDRDKFAELGLEPPTSILDLFQPELAGRVTFPTLEVPMGPPGIIVLAYERGGDEFNPEPGFQLLQELDVLYYYRSSAELATRFAAGDVWAAWWQHGWPPRMVDEAPQIGFASVRVGEDHVGITNPSSWSIATGTDKLDLAYEWLNAVFDAEALAENSKRSFMIPSSQRAREILHADPEVAHLIPDEEQIHKFYFPDYTSVALELDLWVELWRQYTSGE